jgi:hypothetical protein
VLQEWLQLLTRTQHVPHGPWRPQTSTHLPGGNFRGGLTLGRGFR